MLTRERTKHCHTSPTLSPRWQFNSRSSRLRVGLVFQRAWAPPILMFIFLIGLLPGCSDNAEKTYPVRGVVVWEDGTPATELQGSTVELQLKDVDVRTVSPRGLVQDDATFKLGSYKPKDGAPAGEYQALVMPLKYPDEGPHTVYIMDTRFESYATSELEVVVEPKENEIELKVHRPK